MTQSTPDSPLLAQAEAFAADKVRTQPERLQGLAILAVAEAIHRLAAAAERLADAPR